MESVSCLQMQMPLFKPITRQFVSSKKTTTISAAAGIAKPPLRLNYCAKSASLLPSILRPLRCVSASASSSSSSDSIVLRVEGMMCEGCANNVKKLLESRPQVSSASVNLASEIAVVCAVAEEKAAPNWQKQLGEELAQHLTNCGFNSAFRGDSD